MTDVSLEAARAQQMLVDYAHNSRRTEHDWEPILDAYAQSQWGFVWEEAFAVEPALYHTMRLADCRRAATQSLELWNAALPEHQTSALMDMTATLALTQTRARDEALRTTGEWSPQIQARLQAWKEVFAHLPEFAVSLDRETAQMRAMQEEIFQKHPSARPPSEDLPVRIFSVPAACTARVVGGKEFTPADRAPHGLLERLNAFAQEYFPFTRFDLSEDGTQWLLLDKNDDPVDERIPALAQMLDGSYGNAARGMGVLMGNQEVRPGWDTSRMALRPGASVPRPPRP